MDRLTDTHEQIRAFSGMQPRTSVGKIASTIQEVAPTLSESIAWMFARLISDMEAHVIHLNTTGQLHTPHDEISNPLLFYAIRATETVNEFDGAEQDWIDAWNDVRWLSIMNLPREAASCALTLVKFRAGAEDKSTMPFTDDVIATRNRVRIAIESSLGGCNG